MSKLIRIIKGHANYWLDINADLANERTERACKLCFASHIDGVYTGKCQKDAGGCGCPVSKAARVAEKSCPLGVFSWYFISDDRLNKINSDNNFVVRKD
jgi:hypothetical protein